MRSTVAGVVLFLSAIGSWAQESVSVKGMVMDVGAGTPISGARVALVQLPDSTIMGGEITDAKGRFSISRVQAQRQVLRVTYVGYAPQIVQVPSTLEGVTSVDLGVIELEPTTRGEVHIEAQREAVEFHANKKVFHVDKALTAAAGNALDVLKQVPTVNVDQEGRVTVRGSEGVQIQIDGRPITAYGNATQVLQSLPARVLDRVEVINNPGAKYDASGQAGILNIVLKKQDAGGVNGMVTVASGLLDMYACSGTGNMRSEQLNLFASVDAASSRHRRWREVDATFDGGSVLHRDGESMYKNSTWGVRGGVDWTIAQGHMVTLGGDVRRSDGRNTDPWTNTFFTPTGERTSSTYVDQVGGGPYLTGGISANYGGELGGKGHRLTADVYTNWSDFDLPSSFITSERNDVGEVQRIVDGRRSATVGVSDFVQASIDYTKPLDETTRIESGVRVTAQGITSDFLFDRWQTDGTWRRDDNVANSADHQDNVYAAYVNMATTIGPVSLQAGVRGEHTTNYFANVHDPTVNIDRAFGNLFPSVSASVKVADGTDIQASYSKRINRPHATQINPFLDKSDSLNWRTGNPSLMPEYTHAIEAGVLQQMERVMVSGEVFYRRTTNVMNQRFREQVLPNVVLEKPYNFGDGIAYGVSAFMNADVLTWLRMNGEVSYYYQEASGDFREQTFHSIGYGWNGRLVMHAQLPLGVDAQLHYDYTAPQVIPQGRRYAFSIMSLALTKNLMDDRLVVGMNWTDCLNTARFGGTVTGSDFRTELLNQRDYTLLSVNLSYKFNDYTDRRNRTPGGGVGGGANSI